MRLQLKDFELPIIDNSYFNVLKIEDPKFLFEIQKCFYQEIQGENNTLFLSSNDKSLNFNKVVEWIPTIWSLNINDRSSLKKLHNHLGGLIKNRGSDQLILSKWYELEHLLQLELLNERHITISDNLIGIAEIISAFSIAFESLEFENLLEDIMKYLLIRTEYSEKKCFIFNNLLEYLAKSDIIELCNFVNEEEIHLLTIESSINDDIGITYGRHLVIDDDNCMILLRET